MSRKNQKYSESFKLSVLREYYAYGMSKSHCVKKFGLSCSRLLNYWLAQYQSQAEYLSLPCKPKVEDMANRSKSDYQEEIARLRQRILELEKSLEFSRLETQARDLMIDKAEEFFDIPIRKKSGAK